MKRSRLDFLRLAEIFFGIRTPPAMLADELGILYQLFIIFKTAVQIAHIYQIAQMFIMHGMRHLGFFHINSPLQILMPVERRTTAAPYQY
jgi:hypothetical protein